MPTLLNDAIKEAYEYAPADIVYYDTLEIDHASFSVPIYLVNGYKRLTTLQGTFEPIRFEMTLPESTSNVQGEMLIKIDIIPLSIRVKIREVATSSDKMEITYRQYIAEGGNPDAEYPLPLQTISITENDAGIEIHAALSNLITATFPRRIMTVAELPGALV